MELETLRHLLQNFWVNFPINLFDVIILVSFLFYVYEEFSYGFYESLIHLCGIIAGFFLGITVYSYVSSFLQTAFSASKGTADAISFFIIAICTYFITVKLLGILKKHEGLIKTNTRAGKIGALICGSISFLLIASFISTIILSLPISEYIKSQVRDSFSGKIFYSNSGYIERSIRPIFGGAIQETVNFLTVKPESDSLVNLHFKTTNITIDTKSTGKMLILINQARKKAGAGPLEIDSALQDVAILHAKDMFKQGYFSHYTPDGYSPFDRLANKNISYTVAAENLAYAPDVILATNGLLKSPGHRANILNPQFKRIGIGIVDGKIYGKMFVQEFTD